MITHTDDAIVKLMSINDLQKYKFVIPSYQRGYRWTQTQVTNLLDDIKEFMEYQSYPKPNGQKTVPENEHPFYCLQPLVIKKIKETNTYEVIDGQQRLTTILLIMKSMPDQLNATGVVPFEIHFQTRRDQMKIFFTNIETDPDDSNIDIHHMQKAVDTIKGWLEKLKSTERLRWMQTLVDDNGSINTRFIWYEITPTENAIDVFTRLNIGKIQLTDAELVRALFLSNTRGAIEQQLHIAENWEMFEHRLNQSSFWYFLSDVNDTPINRIEILFKYCTEIHIAKETKLNIQSNLPAWFTDEHRIFHYYYTEFSKSKRNSADYAKELWKDIRRIFNTFADWYEDKHLYHLIGFLLSQETLTTPPEKKFALLSSLQEDSTQISKPDFHQRLRERIYAVLMPHEPQMNKQTTAKDICETLIEHFTTLNYRSKRKELHAFLLLFNIATLLESPTNDSRFPFDRYKQQKWDIEHIQPTTDSKPERIEEQRAWLNDIKYLAQENEIFKKQLHKKLKNSKWDLAIVNMIVNQNTKIEDEVSDFDKLYSDISELLKQDFTAESDIDAQNLIGNLTLLDRNTNRSYQNSPFPVKRTRILNLAREGKFVPVATRNVFLKAYNPAPDYNFFWSTSDSQQYTAVFVKTLTQFFVTDLTNLQDGNNQ